MSEELVLAVLRGQSPEYFIYPNAAAFAAEGLDPEQVAEILATLHEAGQVEREQIEIVSGYDSLGEEITDTVGGGYRLLKEPAE